jgi:hypothetical protein
MTHAGTAEMSVRPPRSVQPSVGSTAVLAPLVTALGSMVRHCRIHRQRLACVAVQKTLDRLARENPHPVLTRLRGLEIGPAPRLRQGRSAATRRRTRNPPARIDGALRLV